MAERSGDQREVLVPRPTRAASHLSDFQTYDVGPFSPRWLPRTSANVTNSSCLRRHTKRTRSFSKTLWSTNPRLQAAEGTTLQRQSAVARSADAQCFSSPKAPTVHRLCAPRLTHGRD